MRKMIFFGLGNPGEKFKNTRHNLGSEVLQAWQKQASAEELAKVDCLLPTDFMNNSGQVLVAYLRNSPVELKKILIIHDDIELPLGEVRLVEGGSAKGHNGVKSVQVALEMQDVARLRLGVGRPPVGVETTDFVLGKFNRDEQEAVQEMFEKAYEFINNRCLFTGRRSRG